MGRNIKHQPNSNQRIENYRGNNKLERLQILKKKTATKVRIAKFREAYSYALFTLWKMLREN
jgi:hypothetical protein